MHCSSNSIYANNFEKEFYFSTSFCTELRTELLYVRFIDLFDANGCQSKDDSKSDKQSGRGRVKKLGPRFPRGFENVSHLNGGYGAVADVTCSPAGCFSNGRFAANASRQLLTPAFKSLRLTNDPANIRRPRSRQDREEEIPGLCNPRASGLDIDTQFLTNHRSIEYVPKVRGVCNDDYTRSNWNAVLHREERNGAWITKREIYRVEVARKICANRKSTKQTVERRYDQGQTCLSKHVVHRDVC